MCQLFHSLDRVLLENRSLMSKYWIADIIEYVFDIDDTNIYTVNIGLTIIFLNILKKKKHLTFVLPVGLQKAFIMIKIMFFFITIHD